MPHSDHRKKTVRQNEVRHGRNRDKISAMRTHIKRVLEAIEKGEKSLAMSEFSSAQKKIDKAAKCRIIHPHNAARKKANLSRKINGMD